MSQKQPAIALGFDDGPTEYTEQILDTLKQHGAKASFFVLGQKVDAHADTVRRVIAEGHEIGNHSFDHPHLSQISFEEAKAQMDACDAALERVLGKKPYLGRPPYGSTRNDLGYPMIVWNLDPYDWRDHDAQLVTQRVLHDVQPGDLGILHDVRQSTADAVALIVPQLLERGYLLLTVSELFAHYGMKAEAGKSYYNILNKVVS